MSETPDFVIPNNQGQGGPDSALPRFYVKPVQNNFKTEQEGRPIFDDVEMVEILIPGDRRATFDGRVTQSHKERWPRQYAAFKQAQETPQEGTPLSEWAAITRSQAEELAYMNVRTVEALAGLSDQQLQNTIPMSGFALREKAQRFLEQARGAAPASKLAAENEALKAKNVELEGKVEALMSRVAALESDVGKEPSPKKL